MTALQQPHSESACDGRHIVIIDPHDGEPGLVRMLQDRQWVTTLLRSPQTAMEVLPRLMPDCVLLVLHEAARAKYFELIRIAVDQGIDVLVMGPENNPFLEKESRALGGCDYLPRPASKTTLDAVLANAGHSEPLLQQKDVPAGAQQYLQKLLIGRSAPMQKVFKQIARVAPTSASVLITGESGTGKELVAQAIHRLSRRHDRPFLPINCGAIAPQLIESELFGHEKGSFTGAVRDHSGYFERANGGTLFLDEITEMACDSQVNLLRVLETSKFARVGSAQEQRTNLRIIAATNREPHRAVADGHLRSDLLYRIQVFPIHLPPLRERIGDIDLLIQHFLAMHNSAEGCHKRFSAEALAVLRTYQWPGNLRELKNVVFHACIMAEETVRADDLPQALTAPPPRGAASQGAAAVGRTLAEMEKELIFATLDHCDGRRDKAARMLGVSPKTLYNRLREYRVQGSATLPNANQLSRHTGGNRRNGEE